MIVRFGLLGTGRIGRIHLDTLAVHPNVELVGICDPMDQEVTSLAKYYKTQLYSEKEIFENENIDAVLIASSTDHHARQIECAILNNKHIFCEKPIDLDIKKINALTNKILGYKKKMGIGFNRRFDHNFSLLKKKISSGYIGTIENITIISRDPATPPFEYLKRSGGIVRDMTIHDLDMLLFLLGNDKPVEVLASGSNMFSQDTVQLNDYDTLSTQLKTKSGVLCQIINSRRTSYGYDQRIEVFGSKGKLSVENVPSHFLNQTSSLGNVQAQPLFFFLERYAESYKNELHQFVEAICNSTEYHPNFNDAYKSAYLAEKLIESIQHKKVITL